MNTTNSIRFLTKRFHKSMEFILTKIISNRYALTLLVVASYLAYKSYQPGTILSGWDTLHPEFDFANYFKRILTVWQSHQGLGSPPSQSHIGDLPHLLILWLLSLVFPVSSLRYIYILSMLVIGPLGVYFFSKYFVFSKARHSEKYAFLSGLFYLFNLGTLQFFFTPLEMFVTLYGLMGWFFFIAFQFITFRTRKNYLIFIVVSILLTPISHTATLWFVMYIGLLLTLLTTILLKPFTNGSVKRIVIIPVLLIVLNAFWILPNIYYAKNYSEDLQLSKTHRLGSNEFFLRSQKRGSVKDLMLVTNFPFDWNVYEFGRKVFVPQMENWTDYVKTDSVSVWGYITFSLFIFGIGFSIFKKNKLLISFLPFLFICFFFLRNANIPFTTIFLYLREQFPSFGEVFRFPFTKFGPFYIFFYSIFFAYGAYTISSLTAKKVTFNIALYIFIFLALGQVQFMLPALRQGFVSSFMKVAIPDSYFSFFSYLKNKPKKRILTLPLHSPFGWTYYDWNYQGAGFLWFGVANGLLDREFDRWYPYNEQSYNELSYALYKRDSRLFSQLLDKYRIGYVLLDDSVVSTIPKNSRQITFNRETKELLSGVLDIEIVWQSSSLTLLENKKDLRGVEILSNLINISPPYRFSYEDQAYQDYGDYISVQDNQDVEYPFRTFLDDEYRVGQEIIDKIEPYLDRFGSIVIKPDALLNGKSENGTDWKKIILEDYIHYESKNKTIGSSYIMETYSQDQGYMLRFRSRNSAGLPLRVCIKNLYSGRCDIQDELKGSQDWINDFFVLAPTYQGNGYKIEISNISTGNLSSINDLSSIEVTQFPYSLLKSVNQIAHNQAILKKKEEIPTVEYTSMLGTVVDIPQNIQKSSLLFLNQAYEKNWKAYEVNDDNFLQSNFPFIFGKELKNHVLINNWANGWLLKDQNHVVIVFLPQYLVLLGFGFFGLALILTFKCIKL